MADTQHPKLGLVKKFDLEGIAPNWSAECYLLYRPASIRELKTLSTLADTSNTEALDFMVDFVKAHVISGKVMVMGNDDSLLLGNYVPEYIDGFEAETINDLFSDITGALLSPKAMPSVQDAETERPASVDTTATS